MEEVSRWLPSASGEDETALQLLLHSLHDGQGEGARSPQASGPAAHILLAEDNADMRDYLVSLLNHAGYTVEAVENGSLALAALSRRVPDLLLSDVMMPGLDGLQLLRQVRANATTQRLPVILLSARAGEEAAIEGLSMGTNDYLMKPFSARELLARVWVNVELGRMREQAVRVAQQQSARLQGLYEVLLAVHSTLSPELVLDLISTQARELMGAEYALTSFTTDQEWAQALVSASALTEDDAHFQHPAERASSTMTKAHHLQHLKAQLEPLRQRYAQFLSKPTSSPYWIEAPLLQRNGSEIGLVQLVNKTEGVFTEEDRLVFLQLVQMTSIAVENARLYQLAQDTIATQKESENFTHLLTSFVTQELQAPLSAFVRYLKTTSTALQLVREHYHDRELGTPLQPQQQMIQDLSSQLEHAQHLLTQLQDFSRAKRSPGTELY